MTKTTAVKAFAVHPGLVRTDVVQNMLWYLYYPNTIIYISSLFTLLYLPQEESKLCTITEELVGLK